LVAETWSARELLNAGWREADLAWEEAAERAADAAAQDNYVLAKDEAGRALQLARTDFEPIDPRLGTSLANYGLCLSLSGHTGTVSPLFREALDVWRRADPWIARMDAPRVARSSLFHMRMEALHRDTYRARWQERWQEMADEAKARILALNAGHGALGVTGGESLVRWRRERPAMLNDTRKLMAASFLLLAPEARAAED
jgi:hypothetical protein